MDLARIDYLIRVGLLGDVVRQRWIVPIGGIALEFHGALRPFEAFEIGTRLAGWDERWFYFVQTFRSRTRARPVGVGYVKAIFREAGRTVPPSSVVARVAGDEVEAPPLDDAVRERLGVGGERPTRAAPASSITRRWQRARARSRARRASRSRSSASGAGCPAASRRSRRALASCYGRRETRRRHPRGRAGRPRKFHDPDGVAPGRMPRAARRLPHAPIDRFDAGVLRHLAARGRRSSIRSSACCSRSPGRRSRTPALPPSALAGSRAPGVFVGGFTLDYSQLQFRRHASGRPPPRRAHRDRRDHDDARRTGSRTCSTCAARASRSTPPARRRSSRSTSPAKRCGRASATRRWPAA